VLADPGGVSSHCRRALIYTAEYPAKVKIYERHPGSTGGVVRGLHVRRGDGEAKLVRCSYGAIFDVIVDLRPASPTFRNWESFKLHAEEHVSLYVPAGCAHGFQAVTDPADVYYRIDRVHDPAEDVTIAFDDPDLAIPWPRPVTLMSERDRQAPGLAVAMTSLT
jgi:dTDP-4-dehydrorhamnose 3,5-epimerase